MFYMHASTAVLCRAVSWCIVLYLVCNAMGVIVTLSYNINVVKLSWSWFVMAVEFVMFAGTYIDEPLMQRWKVS